MRSQLHYFDLNASDYFALTATQYFILPLNLTITTILEPYDVYTSSNGDIIEFDGNDEDFVKIIVCSNIYTVKIENDHLNWYTGTRLVASLSVGESITLGLESPPPYLSFSFTIDFISTLYVPYIFSITINKPSCTAYIVEKELLPQSDRNIITHRLNNIGSGPFLWSQFNDDHDEWEQLAGFVYDRLICFDDLPPEPKIELYTL